MPREIEFRAVTQENKIIQDVGCIEFFEDGTIIVNGEIPVKQLIQYTGLKDTNGMKIFEGDKVKAFIYGDETPLEYPVYWEKGAFWIDYQDSEQDRFPIGFFPGSLEVIGNIWKTGVKDAINLR